MTEQSNLPAERVPSRRDAIAIVDAVPIYDTARFEHMQRVATIMAQASLIPDGLRVSNNPQATFGNCFLAVNQAANWDMDPFSVAQCLSVVHGKLCYEGKLIAAVIEKRLKLRLKYEWFGEEGKESFGIKIWNPENPEEMVTGTVGKWQTFEKEKDGGQRKVKGNWKNEPRKQLKYRGDREWARMWAPGLMLGVYSDDEIDSIEVDMRANRAMDATPRASLSTRLTSNAGAEGFSKQHVENEISGEKKTEAQLEPEVSPTPAEQSGDEPRASEEASVSNDAGSAGDSSPTQPAQEHAEQPEAAAANKSASDGNEVVGAAGGQSDAACPPELLHDYSKALFRVNAVGSLQKINDQFWKQREMPAGAEYIVQKVLDLHIERCEGKLDRADLEKKLKEIAA